MRKFNKAELQSSPVTATEIQNSKFISFTFYSKLLYETASVNKSKKKKAGVLKKFAHDEDRQAIKTTISSLLNSNSENDNNLIKAIQNIHTAEEIVSFLQQHNPVIRNKALSAIKKNLETFSIPDDIHSPEEMFFLKLKSLLIFLGMLFMLEEIEDEIIECHLEEIVLTTIDSVARVTIEELKDLKRRAKERSFPSDVYYPWYLHIVCEFEDMITVLIGEWQTEKLVDLLEDISTSINFNKREFSQPDEIYILLQLSELGFAKTSFR